MLELNFAITEQSVLTASSVHVPYSGKFSYGGNSRIIRMPCEHTKI